MKDLTVLSSRTHYNHCVTLNIHRSCGLWRRPHCSPSFLPRYKEASIGRRMFLTIPIYLVSFNSFFSHPSLLVLLSLHLILRCGWLQNARIQVQCCWETRLTDLIEGIFKFILTWKRNVIFSVLIGLFILSWNVILFHFVAALDLDLGFSCLIFSLCFTLVNLSSHNDNLSFLFG